MRDKPKTYQEFQKRVDDIDREIRSAEMREKFSHANYLRDERAALVAWWQEKAES